MIQSASASFGRSSSKFPIVINGATSGANSAAGCAVLADSRPRLAIRLRTAGLDSVRPLACSAGINSRGTMSSKSVSTPALARCAAILAPITPAPSTAAFLILRVVPTMGDSSLVIYEPVKQQVHYGIGHSDQSVFLR